MGKHLSIEEKLNAENELKENSFKIKQLREEINALKYRNKKLTYFLEASRKSKHKGLYGIDGTCYKMFSKRYRELNVEEEREYNKIMKRKSRQKLGHN